MILNVCIPLIMMYSQNTWHLHVYSILRSTVFIHLMYNGIWCTLPIIIDSDCYWCNNACIIYSRQTCWHCSTCCANSVPISKLFITPFDASLPHNMHSCVRYAVHGVRHAQKRTRTCSETHSDKNESELFFWMAWYYHYSCAGVLLYPLRYGTLPSFKIRRIIAYSIAIFNIIRALSG